MPSEVIPLATIYELVELRATGRLPTNPTWRTAVRCTLQTCAIRAAPLRSLRECGSTRLLTKRR